LPAPLHQALPAAQQPALQATEIVIKTDKNETHTIHVLSTDTVRDVRIKIFAQTKIDVERQSIVARTTVKNSVVVIGRTVNTEGKLFLSYQNIAHDNIRVYDRSVETSTPAKRMRTPSRLIGGPYEGNF
jgi:phosphoribosylformylglycinamidine (FGAM) synthase-like enzyme